MNPITQQNPNPANDLKEEFAQRHYADDYDRYFVHEYSDPRPAEAQGHWWPTEIRLRTCPCCGAKANPVRSSVTGDVTIACGQYGCRMVEAANATDAAALWNSPRFTDGPA